MQCLNNLKQLGLATHNYHDTQSRFPSGLVNWPTPPGQQNPPQFRSAGIFSQILAQLEQGPLAEQWNSNDPLLNVAAGRTVIELKILICPSDNLPQRVIFATPNYNPAGEKYSVTSYGGNGGVQSFRPANATRDGVFFVNSDLGLASILDGTSQTLLFGERYHRDVQYDLNAGSLTKIGGWGRAFPVVGANGVGDVTLGTLMPLNYRHPANTVVNSTFEDRRVTAMGSAHPGGANVGLADGSVRFVSQSINLAVWRALSTRESGDLASDF